MSTPWSVVVTSLPEAPTAAREALLLAEVTAGNIVHDWATITVASAAHSIELDVSQDALRVGSQGDAVRITVNAETAQHIADHLDAMLLTARMSDLVRQQAAVVIAPATQTPNAAMANTSRMVLHSKTVDQRVAGQGGLVANAGKDWVLTNKLISQPGRAANYGWHVASSSYPGTLPGLFVLQPLGLAHNRYHVDYSQTVRVVSKGCRVDGVERLLVDVLSDPALAPLVCHEGVLQVFRQPGVPTDVPPPPVPGAIKRVLKRGLYGADVALWQSAIGVAPADGIFGPMTEAATKAWQSAHGLVADGIVGPLTRAAAGL